MRLPQFPEAAAAEGRAERIKRDRGNDKESGERKAEVPDGGFTGEC